MNGRPRVPFSKWMIDLAVPVIDYVELKLGGMAGGVRRIS